MEDSETVESLNELYLAGCFEEIFEYSFEEYVEFTNTNFISNGEVLQRCECGDNCGDYSRWIKEYSEEEGLDPFLVLALIIQESNCRQTSVSSSDSFGIMQINEVTFNDICKDKIEGLSSFSDIKGNGNEEKNIRCGIKILKEKYNIFKEGIKESLPYETNNAFKNICDDCISSYPKYEEYSQFDAALRGYNGWGCGSDADVDYVEKVINIYNILSEYVLLPEYVGDYEEIQIEDETFYVSSSNVCGDETEVVDFKYLSEEYAPKIYIYEPFLEDRSYLFPVDDPKDILSGKTKFIVDVAREESNYDGNIINLSWEIFLPEHLTLREKPIEDQGINYAPYIPFVAKDNSAIVNSRHFKMHATFAKVYPLLGSGEIPYFKKSIDFDFGYFIIVPIKEGKGKLKAILKLKDHLGNCFVYEYLTKEYSSFSFFGSLKGTVTDNLNNPLETFIVELGCGGTKGTGYRKTITDSEGHYLFEEVLVGYGDVCIYEDEEFSTPVYHFRSISIEKDLTEEYNFKI